MLPIVMSRRAVPLAASSPPARTRSIKCWRAMRCLDCRSFCTLARDEVHSQVHLLTHCYRKVWRNSFQEYHFGWVQKSRTQIVVRQHADRPSRCISKQNSAA